MPTYTPSPKRFLVPTQQSAQKPKPKPPSNLRNAYTVQTPKPTALAPENSESFSSKVVPARRFVIAPHRHTQSREHEAEVRAERHTQLTPRPKPRRKFERVESIEEPPKSSPDGPSYDDRGIGVLQTVEHDEAEVRDEEQNDEDGEILFVTEERNKRRRVSPPTSPSTRQSSEPATPVTLRTHRFVVPPARMPAPFTAIRTSTEAIGFTSVTATMATPAPHRPAFILPPQPTSPPKPSKPLPEIFSPSRKSQKYVPNGLASTMQSWIIETANTGFAAQERSTTGGVVWGRDREDGVRLRVRVTAASSSNLKDGESEVECFPGHFVFVRGETEPGMYNHSRALSVVDNDGEMRILLAGQGGARGVAGVKIKIGSIVGVRAPMWDVDVAGEKWMIGVDWVAL
ncbi:hypothetical protein HBI80_009180 [Parastagonospora nodorum]|nr:hypothetical protein HBI80_009180 [Parastagonospora nodorum]